MATLDLERDAALCVKCALHLPARRVLPRGSRLRPYPGSVHSMPKLAHGPADGEPAAFAIERILANVSNIELIALSPGCCGAADSYFLDHLGGADELREPLLDAIRASRPEYVVTANAGRRLHLAAGLAEDRPPEVMHPASFPARHYKATIQP